MKLRSSRRHGVAALALALVEDGVLGLEDDVTTHLPADLSAARQVVLMADAMLTSDAAWAALSGATWAVLCPRPSRPSRPRALAAQ
jgi:hypothetical protein